MKKEFHVTSNFETIYQTTGCAIPLVAYSISDT